MPLYGLAYNKNLFIPPVATLFQFLLFLSYCFLLREALGPSPQACSVPRSSFPPYSGNVHVRTTRKKRVLVDKTRNFSTEGARYVRYIGGAPGNLDQPVIKENMSRLVPNAIRNEEDQSAEGRNKRVYNVATVPVRHTRLLWKEKARRASQTISRRYGVGLWTGTQRDAYAWSGRKIKAARSSVGCGFRGS